uniref:Uncharacterized protein n=1 Tax=Anguilla anguilla TaxID=7936 RepID=A0A0E9T5E5_ANGAN
MLIIEKSCSYILQSGRGNSELLFQIAYYQEQILVWGGRHSQCSREVSLKAFSHCIFVICGM